MNPNNLDRILVMPSAGLGDFIMAAPVIRALRARFPKAYIAALAHYDRGAAEIGAAMPYLDEVFDLPLKAYRWPAVMKFVLTGFLPMLVRLRRKKFQAVIMLHANPIRSVIAKILRPRITLCPTGIGHPTQLGLELAAQLGCSIIPLDFGLRLEQVNLDKYISAGSARPWIGVHPFSAMQWRRWNGYRDLLRMFKPLQGTVFLLGKESVHEPERECVDLVNQLNVSELFSLISRLNVLVSSDSGPMHLGFAAKVPTVAIFGSVPPEFRLPLEVSGKRHVVYHDGEKNKEQSIRIKERSPLTFNPLDEIIADEVYLNTLKLLSSES